MGTGLGLGLTTFSPNTTIASSPMNSNFSSINNSAVSNDSGSITTSGGGVITCTGLTLGTYQHITLGASSTIQYTNGTTARDVFYSNTGSGETYVQMYGSGVGASIRFKRSNGNTICGVDDNSGSFYFADGNGNVHSILYVNTGSGETYVQMYGSGNMIFKDQNGNSMAHLDHSGNLVIKGSLTQNGTP
jgi:hypothetical protein